MENSIETLPTLDSEYAVSEQQASAFQNDGFILLKSVATQDEAAAYQPVISGDRSSDIRRARFSSGGLNFSVEDQVGK